MSGAYPFALFLMAAMLPWQFFVRVARNSVTMTRSKELAMRQIAFPRAVYPLSNTLAESVKLLLALALFPLAALASLDRVCHRCSCSSCLSCPILIAITVGIAWFLAALNFVFRIRSG